MGGCIFCTVKRCDHERRDRKPMNQYLSSIAPINLAYNCNILMLRGTPTARCCPLTKSSPCTLAQLGCHRLPASDPTPTTEHDRTNNRS
jgi:hypothetical protein